MKRKYYGFADRALAVAMTLWAVFLMVLPSIVIADAPDNPASGSGFAMRFGTLHLNPDGTYSLEKEASILPLRFRDTGFRFGVEIKPPDTKPYSVHYVIHLEAAPKVVEGSAMEGVQPSTVLRTHEHQVSGVNADDFFFDPGDPIGDQAVDVYINGKLVTTFKFKVVPDKG